MKLFISLLIASIVFGVITVCGQAASSSAIEIVTAYSQNENYYLKSVPYDNEFPTTRGRTTVYKKGETVPVYSFERGFDSVDDDSNNLILSNDGETIFYLITYGAEEEKDGLKSISIYKNGKLFQSYTEFEITGCDETKERCSILYSNYNEVVDKEKSNWGTKNYKKVFKDGIDEKEKFLASFPVFTTDDVVYLTDSKRKIHTFDLKKGVYIGADSFENVFEQIKSKGRLNKIELQKFQAPISLEFPNLQKKTKALPIFLE